MTGKVYLPTLLAGPAGVLPPGWYDAETLARYGYVVTAPVHPPAETAMVAAPEHAVMPAPAARGPAARKKPARKTKASEVK